MSEVEVRLRPITEADLPDYVCWLNDPEVTQFTSMESGNITLEGEREWFARISAPECAHLHWAIEAERRHIGNCSLHPDHAGQTASFGIIIGDKTAWGKDYGTAAVSEVLGIGFQEMGLHRIELTAFGPNARALRCYEKCGFRHEGVKRQAFLKRGKWLDVVMMGILREEWEADTNRAQGGHCAPRHEPIIRGERVMLRPLADGDLEKALRAWTPELRYMYGGSLAAERPPTPENRRRTFETLRRHGRNHCFAIETGGHYIGFAVIQITDEGSRKARYRIGIEDSAYWGQGYGTEATQLLLRHAFRTLDLHRVELRAARYNMRAIRCYEKCGFRHEGIESDSFYIDGKWEDDVLMAILREDWEADRQAARRAPGEVVIRSYRDSDHEQVVALWRSVGFHLGAGDTSEALAYRIAFDRGPFLVAEADGRIVGTAMGSYDGRRAWLNRVAVAPDMQRRGIAGALMGEVERRLAALGADRALLYTGVESDVARKFYQSLGYEEDHDLVVMWKMLGPGEEEHRGS